MRRQGAILRLRKYGERGGSPIRQRAKPGKYKTREEHETAVEKGPELDAILRALGYAPSFVYEKFRAEWSDGKGEVVVDHTPIGVVAEIEGAPRWINRTARALGVQSWRLHHQIVRRAFSGVEESHRKPGDAT